MFRKVIVACFAAAVFASPAGAGGWGKYGHHGGHYYGGGVHFKHHSHGDAALYVVGGLIGGLLLGHLLSQPRYRTPYPQVTYSRVDPQFTHCRETTGTAYRGGRKALFGGTLCYDRAGRSYIVNESVRFIGYVE